MRQALLICVTVCVALLVLRGNGDHAGRRFAAYDAGRLCRIAEADKSEPSREHRAQRDCEACLSTVFNLLPVGYFVSARQDVSIRSLDAFPERWIIAAPPPSHSPRGPPDLV